MSQPTKKCTKCKAIKPLSEFNKERRNKDGLHVWCRECIKAYKAKYRAEHKDERHIYDAKYRAENKDRVQDTHERYREKHKGRLKSYFAEYYRENKSRLRALSKKWYKDNYASIVEWRESYKPRRRELDHIRRKTDPKYRVRSAISTGVNYSLRNGKEGRGWESLVGYTLSDLTKHLEKQFTDGMTWDNYGRNGWHVDHIIPVSVFNFEKPTDLDFKKCWALSNLQPMWERENIQKSASLEAPFQPSLVFG
jgi:hypothetical protein